MPNDFISQYIAIDQRLVIRKLYYHSIKIHATVPYDMATTDTTIDRVEFNDVTAPYV